MERPKFTIVYNSVSEDGYIGVCWEFFTNEHKAQSRYNELASKSEKYCPTKRPYYHDTDKHHLGAGHWELKNSPNIFDKTDSNKKFDKETPIAKLRNQLSPYYSLPDMVLNMDAKPEMKALLIEQAKRAKQTNIRIRELLCEIEGVNESEKEIDYEENQKSVLDEFFSRHDMESYLMVAVTMHDYDNWDNGTYKGKMASIVPHLMENVKRHSILFAEYLHKYYPNVHKPKNYREVPIEEGKRVWTKAFLADDYTEGNTTELYDEFLEHSKK